MWKVSIQYVWAIIIMQTQGFCPCCSLYLNTLFIHVPLPFHHPLDHSLKASFLQEALSEHLTQSQPRLGALPCQPWCTAGYTHLWVSVHLYGISYLTSFPRIVIKRVYHYMHSTWCSGWCLAGHQYLPKTGSRRTFSLAAVLTNVLEESFLLQCLLTFKNGEPITDGQLGLTLTWI